jgi:hypothetical protein
MADYQWQSDWTNWQSNANKTITTVNTGYSAVIKGTQLLSIANSAMGTVNSFSTSFSKALAVFDTGAKALNSVSDFVNWTTTNLSSAVREIESWVQTQVQTVIDGVFGQVDTLYASVVSEIQTTIGVNVNVLLALAPAVGALFSSSLSMLPASMQGNLGTKLTNLQGYLNICAAAGNMKKVFQTVASTTIMGQMNTIMGYVNVDTWIPSATKTALNTSLTSFTTANYVDTSGLPNYSGILKDKVGLSSSDASTIGSKFTMNDDAFKSLQFGADPRCGTCIVDNSSAFKIW